MHTYVNPYSGQTFFGFFVELFFRIIEFLRGNVKVDQLASDEIQILVLAGIAASASLVGTFLVLRKMTMLANSLSHTILFGIVIAFLFTKDQGQAGSLNIQALLIASVGMGFITTFLTEFLTKKGHLQEDASMGIVFTTLFALGILLVTLMTRNAHVGTEAVMGNADALHIDDLKLVYLVLVLNLCTFGLFYKEFKITTFDPSLARALGIAATFFNYLLMAQVSITVIAAFRAVGVLMVLSFITGPVLTARLLTHDLGKMLLYAVLIGSAASAVGVALSRHILTVWDMALSTGGIVVCTITTIYLIAALTTYFRSNRVKHLAKPGHFH